MATVKDIPSEVPKAGRYANAMNSPIFNIARSFGDSGLDIQDMMAQKQLAGKE